MTITQGSMPGSSPVKDGGELDVKTDDPTWGQVTIAGHFDPSFKNGEFEIASSPGFVADPEKLARIPFIPAEVWANIEPRGPVDAKVRINLAVDAPKPVTVHTELTFKGTTAKLNSLQVETTDTTGHVVIDDAAGQAREPQGQGDRRHDRGERDPRLRPARSPDSTSTSGSGTSTSPRLRRPGNLARSARRAGSRAGST